MNTFQLLKSGASFQKDKIAPVSKLFVSAHFLAPSNQWTYDGRLPCLNRLGPQTKTESRESPERKGNKEWSWLPIRLRHPPDRLEDKNTKEKSEKDHWCEETDKHREAI